MKTAVQAPRQAPDPPLIRLAHAHLPPARRWGWQVATSAPASRSSPSRRRPGASSRKARATSVPIAVASSAPWCWAGSRGSGKRARPGHFAFVRLRVVVSPGGPGATRRQAVPTASCSAPAASRWGPGAGAACRAWRLGVGRAREGAVARDLPDGRRARAAARVRNPPSCSGVDELPRRATCAHRTLKLVHYNPHPARTTNEKEHAWGSAHHREH
jgi:hypothetical protein